MGLLHVVVGEGALGIAVAQTECLAALPFTHLGTAVAVDQLGVFQQRPAGLADHIEEGGCRGAAGYHQSQVALRGRHRGKGGKGGLPAVAAGGCCEQRRELKLEHEGVLG